MLRILRWILVALLPFVGLNVGIVFTPQWKAVWEVSFPKATVFLGQVDDGQTVLLVERDATTGFDHNTLQGVIGLDATTGTEKFRSPLPDELRAIVGLKTRTCQISPDGSKILIINDNRPPEVLLYDWKKREITKTFRSESSEPYVVINGAILRGTTLAAYGFTFTLDSGAKSKAFVTVWDISTNSPGKTIHVGEEATDLHLSNDGKFADIVTKENGAYGHVLIDATTGRRIFTINKSIHDVHWTEDGQRIYVLSLANYNVSIKTYERHLDQFTPIASEYVLSARMPLPHVNSWFATGHWTRNDPSRQFFERVLKPWGMPILDRLWPRLIVLSLHVPETGEVVRSLTIPDIKQSPWYLPDASLDGLYIPQDQSLAYWSFQSPANWPKWLGLFTGLLLATFLARKNILSRIIKPGV